MEENKQPQLELIQLSNYIRPEVKEIQSKEYVMNGDKNSFYNYIIDRYNGSPTNRAIIDSYAKFIYGKGLYSKEQSTKPIQFSNIQRVFSKKDLRNACQDKALFNEVALEVIYEKGVLKKIKHVPKNQVLPSKMDDEGNINSYWFSLDFSNIRKFPPIEIAKWEVGEKKSGSYIYIISSYQVGRNYFTDPVYMAGLPYAELEEELANFGVNFIKNNLSLGHIVNMNQGEPASEEVRHSFKAKLKNDAQGTSNTGKIIVNWNNGKDTEITIASIPTVDLYQQYDALSKEGTQKLMTSHKVVSPILFGIKDSTGLGNNANEMETAFNELMINVIQPEQEVILDAIMAIANDMGWNINLDFIPLRIDNAANLNENSYNGAQISSAIEIFVNVKQGILTKEQAIVFLIQFLNIDKATAESLFNTASATNTIRTQLSKEKQENDPIIADALIELGEVVNNEWELIDEIEQKDAPTLNETMLHLKLKVNAIVPGSFPNAVSEQDTSLFKIRYKYAGSANPERAFCAKMMKSEKVYRKEDIEQAETKVVNAGLGLNGADKYSIWLYKGGVNCQHFWQRQVYLKKDNGQLSVNQARKMILELDPADRPKAQWQMNDPLVAQPAQDSNNNFRAS